MPQTDDPLGLLDFGRNYLDSKGITHYNSVRTEELADTFRAWFHVPPLAKLPDLHALCRRTGIKVTDLPALPNLDGVNVWYEGGKPTIHLREDLLLCRAETTLGHEIREVVETTFVKVRSDYVGLDTSDNDAMNQKSDRFAGCLLMPAAESRALMADLGYDLLLFSRETGRSLPSVLIRAQQLFSETSGLGPVAGIWLFEAPWPKVEAGVSRLSDMSVTLRAHLNGFSIDQGKGQAAKLARLVFPARRSRGSDFEIVRDCLADGRPIAREIRGFDLFRERDYLLVAEPLFVRGRPWRVLVTTVRMDNLHLVRAWRARLDVHAAAIAGRS
jgi:hypothetical protein